MSDKPKVDNSEIKYINPSYNIVPAPLSSPPAKPKNRLRQYKLHPTTYRSANNRVYRTETLLAGPDTRG